MELKAICKGMVQGVGFRAFVKGLADSFKLAGFVRNLEDGDVEICAVGEKEELQNFVTTLKEGKAAYLSEVLVEYRIAEEKYEKFSIRF